VGKPALAVIGGGNLGGAFLAGYLRASEGKYELLVVDPDESKHVSGVKGFGAVADLPNGIDLVIVCVKPQLTEAACRALAQKSPKLVVSFAAGVKLAQLEAACGSVPVVRAMGNTAAAFCASITSLVGNNVPDRLLADFAPLGDVIVLSDEKQMDAAMAISASAPAFFLMAGEGLSDGGVRLGLPREMADRLAVGAIRAAAAVGAHERMAIARQRITSPGGTTIEGLAVLETAAVRGAFSEAAVATAKRAKELLG
jgi:pyrroline-5-carboxylate reductase